MKVSIILSIIFVSMLLLTGCGCSSSEDNKAQTIPSTTEVATTEPTTEALTAEVILSDDVLPNDNSDNNENSEDDYTMPSFEESEDVIIINDDMMTVR